MEQIKVKVFDYLKERYGIVGIYFSHTEDYTIISIPDWNWCYFWNVYYDDDIAKKECARALSDPMHKEHAEEFAEVIYKYLMVKGD